MSSPAAPPRRPLGRSALHTVLGVALVLALLAAGHAVAWRWMAGRLEAGFAAWVAARRAAGWRVEHAPPLRGGWPMAATLTLPRFRLEGGGATLPGGLLWSAESVTLRVSPPRVDRLTVETTGQHRVRLAGLDLPFTADRLAASVPLARDVPPSEAAVQAERLRLGGAAAGVEVRRATLDLGLRSTATEGEAAVSLRLSAEEIALPADPGGLGRIVAGLEADLALNGPVPPGRGPIVKAERWRDGGGTLEARALELRWGAVAATLRATLTLDEALQPMGAGVLRLRGGPAALDAAVAAGLLPAGQARLARLAVLALERRPAEGGAPELEVPLTLEARALTAARLPVARLPAWTWPAAPARPAAAQDPSLPGVD